MEVVQNDGYWLYGLNSLSYDNFIALNRSLITSIGLLNTVMVSELISEARYWADCGELDCGWFYTTVQNVSERCGLSKYQQSESLKELAKLGLVEVSYRGIPRKRHVRVDTVRVIELINHKGVDGKWSKNWTTVGEKTGPQAVEKLDGNNNKEENLEENKRKNTAVSKKSRPTDKHPEEIKAVVDHLNAVLGKSYTYHNRETNRLIDARLEDGFTVDDLKAVIDTKASQWRNDSRMAQYLRPSTLFAPSHFEEYLNESPVNKRENDMLFTYGEDGWDVIDYKEA